VPLETRLELVTLVKSFVGKQFPYDATILAAAIKELLDQKEN
jgi:hypothetical protein